MSKIRLLICAVIILMFSNISQAQYILDLSEEDCVELSLDMIRKGIQQEDTDKIMRVIGEYVSVKGNIITADNIVTQNLSQVFTKSSESNFRYFDMVSLEISINKDTAIVNCELLFYDSDSFKQNIKSKEKLVFWSPYQGQHEKTASNSPFRWKLIECNSLFDYLATCISKDDKSASNEEVQK